VQDTWRANDKLTVTYGMRWEIYFPQTVNGKGKGSNLDFNTGELLVAGYNGIGTNMNVSTSFKTIAPRLGIAYQVHPGTVIRLGYGRSYDIGTFGSIFGEGPTENLPVVASQALTSESAIASVFSLDGGPPAYVFPTVPANGRIPLPDGVSARTRPFHMVIPTVDAWNASLQQQLGHGTSLEVAYVGNKGTHNMFDGGGSYSNNQPTIVGFTPGSNTNLRRPFYSKFGWTQDFTYFNPQNSGSYHALQTKLERRFSNGLQMLANYTWSKSLVYQADYFDIDPRVNYGPAAFNRAHTFNLSGVYDLPFGRQKLLLSNASGWLNQIVGGFTLNGDVTASTGFPFTYSYNECGNDRDTGPCRPDKIASAGLGSRSFNAVDHCGLFQSRGSAYGERREQRRIPASATGAVRQCRQRFGLWAGRGECGPCAEQAVYHPRTLQPAVARGGVQRTESSELWESKRVRGLQPQLESGQDHGCRATDAPVAVLCPHSVLGIFTLSAS